MLKKIRLWLLNRRYKPAEIEVSEKTYTYEQVMKAYKLGYNDGKTAGLRVAREQAQKSLSEILRVQNNN